MPEKKLADRLREAIRLRGYSYRTEKAYLHWYERYVRFHKLRHPSTMGALEVEAFLTVHDTKSNRDRATFLPDDEQFLQRLHAHLERVRRLYDAYSDVPVSMPPAMARKYPAADKSWEWQYVFPSRDLSVDPRTHAVKRHHLHPSGVQRAITAAVRGGLCRRGTGAGDWRAGGTIGVRGSPHPGPPLQSGGGCSFSPRCTGGAKGDLGAGVRFNRAPTPYTTQGTIPPHQRGSRVEGDQAWRFC